jgi:hypothetical protein
MERRGEDIQQRHTEDPGQTPGDLPGRVDPIMHLA